MKFQYRQGVFETNSSSTHCLILTDIDEFDSFRHGKIYFYRDSWDFITLDEARDIVRQWVIKYGSAEDKARTDEELSELFDDFGIEDYDKFGDGYEYFEQHATSPSGDQMVAFGYSGWGG